MNTCRTNMNTSRTNMNTSSHIKYYQVFTQAPSVCATQVHISVPDRVQVHNLITTTTTELYLGEVEHTTYREEQQGGDHEDEAPLLLPLVPPPLLFRHLSIVEALVVVAREVVHLLVAVFPLLVHTWIPTDVHDIALLRHLLYTR